MEYWKSRNATFFNNEIFNPIACLLRAKKKSMQNGESELICRLIIILGDLLLPLPPLFI